MTKKGRMAVSVAVALFVIGSWGGYQSAAGQTRCSAGACTSCTWADGLLLGSQASHSCNYTAATTNKDGTINACECADPPAPGWCRLDVCKRCNNVGSRASQCQNQQACQLIDPMYSLCLGTCTGDED